MYSRYSTFMYLLFYCTTISEEDITLKEFKCYNDFLQPTLRLYSSKLLFTFIARYYYLDWLYSFHGTAQKQQKYSMSAVTATSPSRRLQHGHSMSGESVTKRLQQELMQLMMSSGEADHCTAFPQGDNLFEWAGTITGSADTVYENLQFKLSITFPPNYPYTAPTIKFSTPCFHPNVDEHGNICLDILKEKWSAAYSVRTVLLSLQSLLGEPNNESPLNIQAANLWADQVEYKAVLLSKYREATMKLNNGSSK